MDDPSFFEDDLDEEKAKRSILVTDVPENVSPKDVVIHFQKRSNGGGEVVNLDEHHNEHRSSVVITFEHSSTVESAIKRRHAIKGKEVTVQPYRFEDKIPEIFTVVDAKVNPDVFRDVPALKQVLRSLRRDIGIQCYNPGHGYAIRGSFKKILLCHRYILEDIRYGKSLQQMPTPESSHDDLAIEGASISPHEMDATTTGDGKIDAMFFDSVPIILQFIFAVSKYAKKIHYIESRFHVKISEADNGSKVEISPLQGCTRKQHDDACEEYINLYKKVCDRDGPMVSENILLKAGKDSSSSAESAVKQVLRKSPVAIQKMDEQDKWLFYGEDKDVRFAIKEVCLLLKIDNPVQKHRKARVRHVQKNEENGDGVDHDHFMPLGNNVRKENALPDDLHDTSNPVYEDIPADAAPPFFIKTKKGFRLSVYQGDIVQERINAIVNTIDEHLGFSTGLSKALVNKGGEEIEKHAMAEIRQKKLKSGEVITTGPGNLHCSKILHLITNNTRKSKDKAKMDVKEGCLNCLKKAKKLKLNCIAFPALGTGLQGLPLATCATAMVNAVEEYMKQNDPQNGTVADIRFVHLDLNAVEVFQAELGKRYGDSIVKPPGGKGDAGSLSLLSPDTKTRNKEEEEDCPICLDGFHNPVTLTKCKHRFCKQCIDRAFQRRKVCPTCGMAYGVQTGNMPPGTMNYYVDRYLHLPGYERCDTIRIEYHFSSGTQGSEHPNPGQRYTGTSRTAYLPDCREGREVLGLLKKAFDARLTFTIGRSVTTGASNVVTWNDIHHKTNTQGGATGFGYPDPTYLKRVKEELAAKGIS